MKILLLLSCFLIGCWYPSERSRANPEVVVDTPQTIYDLILKSGNLSANMDFVLSPMPLEVSTQQEFVPVQVGAFIIDLDMNVHDPDFLRVKFSSDRVEWVGYSSYGNLEVFDSLEECTQSADYCESIEVGEGTSGYFGFEDGYIAIQNTYCRYKPFDYSYSIKAQVIDLYQWPIAAITNEASILIECQNGD